MFEILGLIGIVASICIVILASYSLVEEYEYAGEDHFLSSKKEILIEAVVLIIASIALISCGFLLFIAGLVWLKVIVATLIVIVNIVIALLFLEAFRDYLSSRNKKSLFSAEEVKISLMGSVIFFSIFVGNIFAIIGMFV